ncbi:MAG: NAD-dependent deacylase [candidate division KSB1 bacterium]|nr:NAD-dependent deacylase [candidate division KSB1 bacterium]
MEPQGPFSSELVRRLRSAHRVAALTGAGISAESGVPTFRGEDGLWKRFRPEELANVEAFLRNPSLVWEWYQYRRRIIREVEPNPGHKALADLEKLIPDFVVITQNVDGLHQRAGSRRVIELHGNILRNRCLECGKPYLDLEVNEGEVPHCSCGGLVRPDVVWFGELLPQEALTQAYLYTRTSDVFLTIGTSAVVQPAASLPLEAKSYGAYVVEINTEPTPITPWVDEHVRGRAGEILPKLVAELARSKREGTEAGEAEG